MFAIPIVHTLAMLTMFHEIEKNDKTKEKFRSFLNSISLCGSPRSNFIKLLIYLSFFLRWMLLINTINISWISNIIFGSNFLNNIFHFLVNIWKFPFGAWKNILCFHLLRCELNRLLELLKLWDWQIFFQNLSQHFLWMN